MPNIKENINLKPYNSLAIAAQARYFTTIRNLSDIKHLRQHPFWQDTQKFILGTGSNLLFKNDFPGLILHVALRGIPHY